MTLTLTLNPDLDLVGVDTDGDNEVNLNLDCIGVPYRKRNVIQGLYKRIHPKTNQTECRQYNQNKQCQDTKHHSPPTRAKNAYWYML